jgi:hypothetical protein
MHTIRVELHQLALLGRSGHLASTKASFGLYCLYSIIGVPVSEARLTHKVIIQLASNSWRALVLYPTWSYLVSTAQKIIWPAGLLSPCLRYFS